jgi:hypothetical protein
MRTGSSALLSAWGVEGLELAMEVLILKGNHLLGIFMLPEQQSPDYRGFVE